MNRKESSKFRLEAATGSGIEVGNAICIREKSEILKSGVCSWGRWQPCVSLTNNVYKIGH